MLLRLAVVACLLLTLGGEAQALPAPLVRAWKTSTRAVSRTWSRATLGMSMRARMGLDAVEQGLERKGLDGLARSFGESRRLARPFSPLALTSFVAHKLKERPSLLKGYLMMEVPFNIARYAALPLLPAVLAAGVLTISSLPILDVAYFVTAEHLARRRAAPPGQKPSLRSTLRTLGREYAEHRASRDRKLAALMHAARREGVAMQMATP